MEMYAPTIRQYEIICWLTIDVLQRQIRPCLNSPVRKLRIRLMQITWLHELTESLPPNSVLRRIQQLNRVRDMDFIDSNSTQDKLLDGFCNIFKLNRLMTDIETDPDVFANDRLTAKGFRL